MGRIIVITLLFTLKCFSQDSLFYRNGTTSLVKIEVVGVSEIKFYRFDNPNGPLYSVLKTDIKQIVYKNGVRDNFLTSPIVQESDSFEVKNQPSHKEIIRLDTVKNNFLRFYFTNLFVVKLSFSFEKQISNKRLIELQVDYRFYTRYGAGATNWDVNSIFFHQGFEVRPSINQYLFRFKRSAFTAGVGISYRYVHASDQIYIAKFSGKYSDRGVYRMSQTRNYGGFHLKLTYQLRYKKTGIEAFIQPGVYAGNVKNSYFEYKGTTTASTQWQSDNIPKIQTSYMKDGFSIVPNFNFGIALRVRIPKKGEIKSTPRFFKRDTVPEKRSVVKFYITSVLANKVAFSYERIIKRGISIEFEPAYIFPNPIYDYPSNLFFPNTAFKNSGFELIAGLNVMGTNRKSYRQRKGARGLFISYRYQHTGKINYWTGGMSGKGYHYSYYISQTKNLASIFYKRTYFPKGKWESFMSFGVYAGYARTVCFYYSGNYSSDKGSPEGTFSPSGLPFSNGLVIMPFVRVGLAVTSGRQNNK